MHPNVLKKLEEFPAQRESLVRAGQDFICDINGMVFPADAMFMAALDRGVEQSESFILLVNAGHYGAATSILRMQIDTVLRLYGLLLSKNAHETASKVISGEHLRRLKDAKGKPMSDRCLVECLSKNNPDIKRVYEYCSGYIHFSNTHFSSFLGKSISEDGIRTFYIGSGDERISEEGWLQLVSAFANITVSIVSALDTWRSKRSDHGVDDELLKRFPCAV